MENNDINKKIKSGNQFFLFCMTIPVFIIMVVVGLISELVTDNTVVILVLSSIGLCLFPVMIYFGIANRPFTEVISIKKISLKNTALIVAISFFIQPVMSFLAVISSTVSDDNVTEMVMALTENPFILAFIAIAVVPAINEELLMRGVVSKYYDDLSLKNMALINGLFFGLFHANLEQFLYAFLLGFIFMYMYKLTGSILAPILSHMLINGTQITMAYFVDMSGSDQAVDMIGMLVSFVYAIPFAIIVYVLMKKFIKNNRKVYDEINAKTLEEDYIKPKFFDIWLVVILVVYVLFIVSQNFI